MAAEEEREAHRALAARRGPMNDWSPEEAAEYRARLEQWQSASRALVEALDRLERVQRRLAGPHAPRNGSSATA